MAPSKVQPALLGGLVIGVLSALPVINLANCCCAWILFGGGLAAHLLQQNDAEPITVGDGAVAGLLAGVVGAFVWLVLIIPISTALAPFQGQMIQRALRNATEMAPEARAFLEGLSSGPVVGIGLVFSFVAMLCVCSVFGMLGGLFGTLIFRKSAPPPPPPPPPYFPGSTPDGLLPPPLPGEERR